MEGEVVDTAVEENVEEKILPISSLERNRTLSVSQCSLRSGNDNDSSATLSADEGPHGSSELLSSNRPPSRPQSEGLSPNINLVANVRPHSVPFPDSSRLGQPARPSSGPGPHQQDQYRPPPSFTKLSATSSSERLPQPKSVTTQHFTATNTLSSSLPQLPPKRLSEDTSAQVPSSTHRLGHDNSSQPDPKNDKASRPRVGSGAGTMTDLLQGLVAADKKSPGKTASPTCVRDLIHSAIERNLQQHLSNDAPVTEARSKCIPIIFISRRAIGRGTGDIATPPVRPSVRLSVTFSFRTATRKRIDVFSRNFAGTCTMSWGCAV